LDMVSGDALLHSSIVWNVLSTFVGLQSHYHFNKEKLISNKEANFTFMLSDSTWVLLM